MTVFIMDVMSCHRLEFKTLGTTKMWVLYFDGSTLGQGWS